MAKIYTKTGDKGMTGLIGGERVRKDSPVIESVGALDELNAHLGILAVNDLPAEVADLLPGVQSLLFDIGAEVAAPVDSPYHINAPLETMIGRLEVSIDVMTAELPELKNFILPGGARAAAEAHLARTVCRRVERVMVGMSEEFSVRAEVVVFLNRLSDWLFTAARFSNHVMGRDDVPWVRQASE